MSRTMGEIKQPATEHIAAAKLDAPPEPGDILLFGPDGKPIATLIQIATHSHYHHIALYEGDGMVLASTPHRDSQRAR